MEQIVIQESNNNLRMTAGAIQILTTEMTIIIQVSRAFALV